MTTQTQPTVAIIGNGAREAAMKSALEQTRAKVVVTPKCPGIAGSQPLTDQNLAGYDLVVIGPEGPLVDDQAGRIRQLGGLVFGPGAAGARLEGSKVFMKEMLMAAGIRTASYGVAYDVEQAIELIRHFGPRVVVKTDWLKGGKGVLVAKSIDEASADARAKFAEAEGDGINQPALVIEETLDGDEISIMYLCDGHRVKRLPVARDYKPVGDGNTGPNTGGMGAFCPVTGLTCLDEVDAMAARLVAELKRRGIDYRGALYFGLMLTRRDVYVLEINCRFGDPETQVILPLVDNLLDLLMETAQGKLVSAPMTGPGAAVAITFAATGYPGKVTSAGAVIGGVELAAREPGISVYLPGVDSVNGQWAVDGGRVLSLVAHGPSVIAARHMAYDAAEHIECNGLFYRTDIAGA